MCIKDTIAVAIAQAGRSEPTYCGEIANTPQAIRKLMGKLSPGGEVLSVCYEAGPCGYVIQRRISAMGHDCAVVAPGLIPRKATDRVKTDRRDALSLARLHRAGELTAVWVLGDEQEAMRDLTRAREDMKAIELKARQRLGAFLLRHGHVYSGKSRWTQGALSLAGVAEDAGARATDRAAGVRRCRDPSAASGGGLDQADARSAGFVVTVPGR